MHRQTNLSRSIAQELVIVLKIGLIHKNANAIIAALKNKQRQARDVKAGEAAHGQNGLYLTSASRSRQSAD
jgi:hypothetical protein